MGHYLIGFEACLASSREVLRVARSLVDEQREGRFPTATRLSTVVHHVAMATVVVGGRRGGTNRRWRLRGRARCWRGRSGSR